MDLGEARRLFAGKGGERWLVQAREGTARAAAQLADEDLVAITRPDDGTFAFIGDLGSVYVAKSPLGPFEEVRRIDPPPMRVAAAARSIVAVGWDGNVRLSVDAGRSFREVPVQGARPYDVALAPDGRAMLLGFPERLWVSRDGAASWTPAGTPPVGAGMIGLDANGSLVARGVLQSVVWGDDPGASPQLEARALELPPLDLLTDLEPGPSAEALATGHAAIAGTTYFEVARRDEDGPWYFARGALTDRIRWVPIPQTEECKHMSLGASGRRVVIGCMSGARRGGVLFPPLRVLLSRDGGSTFTPRRPTPLVADEESVSLTVLPDDTLIVSGACKPDTRGICSPAEPIRLVPSRESQSLQFVSVEASKVPPIVGRVGPVQRAEPSGRLYATATLAARRRHAVLVSDDGGESFRAIPLDLTGTAVAAKHDAKALLSHMQPGRLTVSSDGSLSWVLYAEPGPIWVTMDRRGKVLSAHLAPADVTMIEAAGLRGLATGDEEGLVWESTDGGASFQRLARLPTRAGTQEALQLWCEPGGCVFGDVFSRVGWGDAAGGILDRGEPKDEKKRDEQPEKQQHRTPIVCELVDSSTGTVDDVVQFPSGDDAQRGGIAWSALVVDPKTGAVQVVHASDQPAHATRLVTLLPPVPNPDRYAVHATPQAEGAAALRYAFTAGPDGAPIVGSPIRRIDVAWDNQFEGPPQRASIAQPGNLRAGDVTTRGKGVVAQANVAMLSVAPGGIHVCAHKQCDRPDDHVRFLRGRGPADTIAVPPWPTRGLGGGPLALSHHVMHVDKGHVPVALHQHRSVVLRAERDSDGSWRFPALGLSPLDAKDLGLREISNWSHLGSKLVGLMHTVVHPVRPMSSAHVLRFDTDEGVATVIEVPTSRMLADPPAVCSAEQRSSTFRMPAPMPADTQHPVIIEHGRMKEVLYTKLAMMHGDLDSPCAVVLDARSDESSHRRAIIPLGTMDKAWLFSRGSTTLQWFGMRCRFEPGAKVDGETVKPPPPSSPPPPAAASTKRPATDAECEEIFDKMLGFMGGTLPPGALQPARDAFKGTCRGKPVDMQCVRGATNAGTLMSSCLDL